jgi:ArsR family transcriptional regulator, arsenate/arsenite/antimonite-responsive transcriptional repressor / arsenate reductase (thioredoxin)
MPAERPLRVLFLCTGNSARSQMAETLLRSMTGGNVQVISAGSSPRPEIHPLARAAVSDLFGLGMEGQYPKPLERFLGQQLDYVISVCDRANASCPVFPGDTERIHWSFEDPAEVEGGEESKRRAFEQTARDIATRLRLWLSLPAVSSRVGGESG